MANTVKQGTSNVNPDRTCRSALLQDGISAVESLSGVSTGFGGVFLPNVSTSSLGGASENETDEYDCESEVWYFNLYFLKFGAFCLSVCFLFGCSEKN